MRTTLVLLWLFISLVVLTSCVGPSFPNRNTNLLGSGLLLEIWVNTTDAEVGTPIQIRYTVTHTGDQTRVVELADRPVMDIVISFQSWQTQQRTVTRWSDGQEITEELRRMSWEPGESKTLEMTWVVPELADDTTVRVGGTLRFGEREGESTGAGVTICVGSCLPG